MNIKGNCQWKAKDIEEINWNAVNFFIYSQIFQRVEWQACNLHLFQVQYK